MRLAILRPFLLSICSSLALFVNLTNAEAVVDSPTIDASPSQDVGYQLDDAVEPVAFRGSSSDREWPWPPRALSTPGGQFGGSTTPPKNPAAGAYKKLFFDNDFSYLLDPEYTGHALGEDFKLMPCGPDGRWGTHDIGGQLRMRYHHEIGMGQSKLDPALTRFEDTEFNTLLPRLRLYHNWMANEHFRVYIEGIATDVIHDSTTYQPRQNERNYDILNGFVDFSANDVLTCRIGRQEIVYGAERLLSITDWANVRRTFEGLKLLYRDGDWAIDGFYLNYVPPVFNRFDSPDYDQPVYGTYAVYEGFENNTVDLYYIGYDNRHVGTPVFTDFSTHTVGSRLFGNRGDWLYELEGGCQFGRQSGLQQNQDAGFGTAGLGHSFADRPMKPVVWCYYDYASGNAGGADYNGFNQIFPWGHRYFGFIDAVWRTNVSSPNVLTYVKPNDKWTVLFWYWRFMADIAADDIISFGGTPDQSPGRTHFGDELDILAQRSLGPRSNIQFGYSHLWRGNKILAPRDADFTYIQWELNF